MIRLRFIDSENGLIISDTFVESFDLSRKLNQAAEWTAVIPLNVEALRNIEQGHLIEASENGVVFLSGELQQADYGSENDSQLVKAKGRDLMDDLFKASSFANSYVENFPFLVVLGVFLYSAGWRIGDISTLANPDAVVTIDLRAENHLLSQIQKLIETLPRTNFRHVGDRLGYPAIDVGSFGNSSGVRLLKKPDGDFDTDGLSSDVGFISSLKIERSITDIIEAVHGQGGEVTDDLGVLRTVHLGDHLKAVPTLALDPDFPIVEVVSNLEYVVINAGIAKGGKTYSLADNNVSLGIIGTDGANVEYFLAERFTAFPGRLSEIGALFGAITGSPAIQMTWRLCAADGVGGRPGTIIATGLHTPRANTFNRITVSSGPILSASTYYWLVLGYATKQAVSTSVGWRYHPTHTAPVARGYQSTNSLGVIWDTALTPGAFTAYLITTPIFRTKGTRESHQWKQYAPERTEINATLVAIQGAAAALYDRVKTYLTDHQATTIIYDVEAEGAFDLKVGDTVYVKGTWKADIIDPFTGIPSEVEVSVDKELRVVSFKRGNAADTVNWDIELSDGDGVALENLFVSLYDAATDREPPAGTAYVPAYVPKLTVVGPLLITGAPDTVMSSGLAGKLATITLVSPVSIVKAADVTLAGIPYGVSPNGDLVVEMVSDADFTASTPAVVRLSIGKRGWNVGDSASLNARYLWL